MTRAVHALHMIVAPSGESEKSLSKTFAGLLRAGLHEARLQNPPSTILCEHGDKGWFQKHADAVKQPTEPPSPPTQIRVTLRSGDKPKGRRFQRQAASDLKGGPSINLRDRLQADSVLTRTRGALWHAWMQEVDWLDDPQAGGPSDQRLTQLAGQFLHPRLKLADEINRFRQALDKPAIREVLSRTQYGLRDLELHHDHPIAYREHHVLTRGVIDRLVILRQNGKVTGADILAFKTDPFAEHDSKSANNLGRYYEPQLAAYGRAVQEVFGLSPSAITARILFLEAGQEWRPMSP
jgi:ATP-dependent exoDNAse (exonuclease V) beta subunit